MNAGQSELNNFKGVYLTQPGSEFIMQRLLRGTPVELTDSGLAVTSV